ncbi:phosphatase 2C-like domain-containing protein [Clohesyomyces aquaticus]|uniref:Phosphatase 2C-like domain-containing protein n=1 Tax=Clohesyomyces aquaticus TaxID=1231657 RepID=A0A1Y2A3G4_9PLEO|nr:phosphatase 2C-like domain-containing protein [Clohesyomyces aquaticus]
MISPVRWRTAIRQIHGQKRQILPSLRQASTRPKFTISRPPQLALPKHVNRQLPAHIQSRFPTKTFITLLVLGGLGWYFIESVEIVDHWTGHVPHKEPNSMPVQFHKSREDVEHWLNYHVPDLLSLSRHPQLHGLRESQFAEEIAHGWMMSEEDAAEKNMPVTHGAIMDSNRPCEDEFAIGLAPGPGSESWSFWGVYDGHAGSATSRWLQWTLIPTVSNSLSALHDANNSNTVTNAIMQAFTRLDSEMMTRAKHAASWYPPAASIALEALDPALSGSCALLACFDPKASKLRVACTGDSRAVLGRWDPSSQSYIAKPLSVDQTGFNPLEVSRLAAEHPNEPDIIDPKSGRLLGIAVTRAFGDHRWKWDNEFISSVAAKFWGTAPRPGSKTPPYMTAEPVVTETDIISGDDNVNEKPDFMIMASDGLWDKISSADAVTLISQYLTAKASNTITPPRTTAEIVGAHHATFGPDGHAPGNVISPSSVKHPDGITYSVDDGKLQPVDWRAEPQYFAIEDENAAVCLIRNALGGSRKELLRGVLSVQDTPRSRNVFDDTTVLVVFFGRGEEGKGRSKGRSKGKMEAGFEGTGKAWWKFW